MAFAAYQNKMASLRPAEEANASATPVDRVVAMVVHEGEFNAMDQRLIEYELLAATGIEMVRLTLRDIAEHGTLTADSLLHVTLPSGRVVEVAVAYYRTGYSPKDYPTEAHWDARLTVEKSHALKCPNAAWHLTGTKKMQQVTVNSRLRRRQER